MPKTDLCCPDMTEGKKCDYLDFVYRLRHLADVNSAGQNVTVPVEVAIHVRAERCTGPLRLGNLVYSTTLIPGEKVRLFSMDRRSRFSFDAESQLTYRHESIAEEQYYMNSFESFMSDLQSRDHSRSTSTSTGSASSTGETSGLFGTIFNGPSVTVSGNYNASSTQDFIRELSVHAQSSHNKSIGMTRHSSAISIGEVQSRQHAEGESESQLESSARTFENKNKCHAVTYLFYQVDKEQTIKFTVRRITTRVIDPAGDSAVVNNPVVGDDKLSLLPTAVLATPENISMKKATNANARFSATSSPAFTHVFSANVATASTRPLDKDIRDLATEKVMRDLAEKGIVDEKGSISKQTLTELSFEFKTTIPTPGIVVKGCLDDCNVCDPAQQEHIKLELEKAKLKNQLLVKRIELLDKSQEYRCCPAGENVEEGDAA
ncbi:hypothetical protein [Kaarinaea lacus]